MLEWAELADARDSKSRAPSLGMRVRPPPPAPRRFLESGSDSRETPRRIFSSRPYTLKQAAEDQPPSEAAVPSRRSGLTPEADCFSRRLSPSTASMRNEVLAGLLRASAVGWRGFGSSPDSEWRGQGRLRAPGPVAIMLAEDREDVDNGYSRHCGGLALVVELRLDHPARRL